MSTSRPHADAHWMRRALVLARSRAGQTWPNPTVGACIVRDGRLLAEAVHEAAGQSHAEAAALAQLRERAIDARGSTLYVTLEPCHHQGRTPPCTRDIVAAGIARVVYAVADESPRQHGGGAAWLVQQGVQVERGPLTALAWELNHPFFETRDENEAHLTLKIALSLDGRMAPRAGRIVEAAERRITGERTRRRVHRMRAGARAILVGRGTVECDRPRLDLRHLPAGTHPAVPPRAVVLDSLLRIPEGSLPAGALVFTSVPASGSPTVARSEVVRVELARQGRLAWPPVLRELIARGLGVILVEAGPTLASELVAAALPHRIHLFLAPRTLGGDGPQLPALPQLEACYEPWRARRVGADLEWVLRRRDLPRPSA